jgi:hypothetical protein
MYPQVEVKSRAVESIICKKLRKTRAFGISSRQRVRGMAIAPLSSVIISPL